MKYKNSLLCQIGVSFGSAICSEEYIKDIHNWNAQIVEIPVGKEYLSVSENISQKGLKTALHVPSYEMIRKKPFIRNMHSEQEVYEYVSEIEGNVKTKKNWEYIVIHYPLIMKTEELSDIIKLNYLFLKAINGLGRKYRIPIYLENVAVCSRYYLPEIYEEPLSWCDGFCFDIGHAHNPEQILFNKEDGQSYTSRFFELYREKIIVIHLYNTTNRISEEYSLKTHYPFLQYAREYGFMDAEIIKKSIVKLPNLQYVIHEPHREEVLKYHHIDFGILGSYNDLGHITNE